MESDDTVTFCQNDLITTSFAAFQDMKKNEKHCDLIIQLPDKTIRAHRVIVSAAIPYLDTLFPTGSNSDPVNNVQVFENLEPDALVALIDFAYTTKIEISPTNVQSLFLTAQLLQLHQVQEACVQFLSQRLQINNVLQVHEFAIRIQNSDLVENVNRFITDKFQEFCQCEDFVSLSSSCLKAVISEDDLNVSDEETVFEAIIKWVKKSSERISVLPDLLSEVRMIYIPKEYLLRGVSEEDLIRGSIPCRDLLNEVKNYLLTPGLTSLFPNLKTSRRKSVNISEKGSQCLYTIFKKGTTVFVNRCDFVNKAWESVTSYLLKGNPAFSCAVCVNDTVYILFLEETLVTLDLKSMEWMTLEPKHKSVDGSAVIAHGNIIYFFGSRDFDLRNKVQRFNTVENKWLTMKQMTTGRQSSGVAALDNSIYITGGYHKIFLNTVEKYDTVTMECSTVASMLNSSSGHGCCAMNGKIYICGGFNSNKGVLCTAEVYDPLTNEWNSIKSMNTRRSCFPLLSNNNQIYAIGGELFNSSYSLREMETYDVENDQWTSTVLLSEQEKYPAYAFYFCHS